MFNNKVYNQLFKHEALVFDSLADNKTVDFSISPLSLIKAGSGTISLPPYSVNKISEISANPFLIKVPGVIETENYATMLGISTSVCTEGGYYIGDWTTADSTTYKIDVPTAGTYNIDFRVSSLTSPIAFVVKNGKTVLTTINSTASGAIQTFKTVSSTITLPAGKTTLTILATGAGWNINWFEIKSSAPMNQTISFSAIPTKAHGDIYSDLGATATSGLPVSYVSNNTAVATVVGSTLNIIGPGTANITASQAGNTNYNAATSVVQALKVYDTQFITLNTNLSSIKVGTAPFWLSASSTSGLAVSFACDNPAVATISSGSKLTIVGAGSANITCTQAGNTTFQAAEPLVVPLVVNNVSTIISPNATENNVNLYPNPAQYTFNVSADGFQNAKIKIIDLQGISIYQNNFDTNNQLTINTNAIGKGWYLVTVSDRNSTVTKKLIIQ